MAFHPPSTSSSVSIGDTITGGTNLSVLFINPAGVLAQDNPDFTYNPATNTLTAGVFSGSFTTSFTQGSVIFAGVAGVLAQDNASFFWNDTNNYLGIGTATPAANVSITRAAVQTSGVDQYLLITPVADTALTASTNAPIISLATATRQHATGALALQTDVIFNGQTLSAVGATTITEASTLYVTSPIAGTNATITSAYAAHFQANAIASVGESIARFDVSDNTGFIVFENATGTDSAFSGTLRMINSTAGLAAQYTGQGTTDTGSTEVTRFVSRIGASTTVATRPAFFWNNSGTTVMALLGSGATPANKLLVGDMAATPVGYSPVATRNMEVTRTAAVGGYVANTFSTTAAQGSIVELNRSKSATVGTFTIVAAQDQTGALVFQGADGADFEETASITSWVDGTPGSNDMPGRLCLETTLDGAAAPTERVRISNAGLFTINTGVASSAAYTTNVRNGQLLEMNTSANFGGSTWSTWSTTAGQASQHDFNRSKSATIGTKTVVVSADALGFITFRGADGTNFIEAAQISAAVDGTPGTNDMPGRLVFSTTLDGAATVTERMRIDNLGQVGIGVTPTSTLHLSRSAIQTSGIVPYFTLTPVADTGLTASTEAPIFVVATATRQHATGALALQRDFIINAQTLSAVGATTISDAATFAVSGVPIQGTNATLTKVWSAVFGTPEATVLPISANAVGVFGAGLTSLVIRNTTADIEAVLIANTTNATAGTTTAHSFTLATSNITRATLDLNGKWVLNPGAAASGIVADWVLTPAANTSMTAATESNVFRIDTATRSWATGTVGTNRDILIRGMTYAASTSTLTVTDASTFAIDSAPISGTNTNFTTVSALRMGGNVSLGATSSAFNYSNVLATVHTATVTGSTQVTAACGASQVNLGILTITDVSAVTMDAAATLYIAGAVAQAGSVTITNKYSLWVDAGTTRLDGTLTSGSGRIQALRIATTNPVTVATTDDVVETKLGSPGAVAVSLPATPEAGRRYTVKDGTGDAASNNITVTPAAGNIDGAGTNVINSNYGSRTYMYDGAQWLII